MVEEFQLNAEKPKASELKGPELIAAAVAAQTPAPPDKPAAPAVDIKTLSGQRLIALACEQSVVRKGGLQTA